MIDPQLFEYNILIERKEYWILMFILCFCPILNGQNLKNVANIESSHITTFSAANGLPVCLGDIFQAPNGKMFVTSCGPGLSGDNRILFEYDGYRSVRVPFHELLVDPEAVPIFLGMNEGGELFGRFEQHSTLKNSFFIYNLVDYQLRIIELPYDLPVNSSVLAIDYFRDVYTIWSTSSTAHHLLEYKERQFNLLHEFSKDGHGIADSFNARPQIERKSNDIWLWAGYGSILWQFNHRQQIFREYTCEDFPKTDCNDPIHPGLRMIDFFFNPDSEEPVLVSSNENKKFYQFDAKQNKFIPTTLKKVLSLPKAIFDYKVISSDQKGNTILVFDNDSGKEVSLMRETDSGIWYEIPSALEKMKNDIKNPRAGLGYQILGKDFRQTIISLNQAGISLTTLKSIEAIRTFPLAATRGISELDEHRLLVREEAKKEFSLVNLNSGEISKNKEVQCLSKIGGMLTDVYRTADSTLFITDLDQLIQFDSPTKNCHVYNLGFSFSRFTQLNDGRMAIVSDDSNELFYYNFQTRRKERAESNGIPVRFSGQVYKITQSSDGMLWVGTQNGLWKVDPRSNSLETPQTLLPGLSDVIYSIEEGEEGQLWLGTGASGLYIFDPKTTNFTVLDAKSGLSNNTVIGILTDEEDKKWISTYHGLNLVSSKGKLLAKIYEEDGLANNEGNRFSAYKMDNGMLAFGTIDGLSIIDPIRAKKRFLLEGNVQISLTELTYFSPQTNRDTTLSQPIDSKFIAVLPADKRHIKLRVNLSDLRKFRENQYEYRLESANKEPITKWIFLGNNPEFSILDLPAGKYQLVIRGKNYRGQIVKEPLRISIHAKELFYKTTEFFVLIVFLVFAAPFLWLIRERIVRKRLESLVRERTKKIENDKKVIEEQAEKLKSLDEVKSRFFADISHEFRTPLTIISGMTEQIEKKPDLWLKKGVNMIRKSSSNLLDLVNQILDLRKLEAGSIAINLELGDVIPLLRNLSEQFEGLAQSKNLTLTFETDVDELIMDHDPKKLIRIVTNLLSNATKYSTDKGVIKFRVSTFYQNRTFLKLSIADSGQGIASSDLEHIFDRFYRAESKRDDFQLGTGIGLALTRELIHLLGGKIDVTSELDVGSTFQVILPVTRKANPSPGQDSIELQKQVFGIVGPDEGLRITNAELPKALIVEDNQDIAQYLGICLKDSADLLFAANGKEGLEMAVDLIPDIIVSDVMMPLMNGLELCQSLKKDTRTSHIPIILLTAKSDVASRIEGLKKGADDYLAKPFHEEELLVRLKNLLKIRHQLQERYSDLYNKPFSSLSESESKNEDEFILNLKEIFEQHLLDSKFDLNLLSKKMFLSRSQFGRKVKALTGKSPTLYLRLLRLQKARHLLLNSKRSIKEIAYEVGFSDPNYFTRSYVEEFGESPSKTRNV